MAYSYAIHIADGSTTDFTVPFPFLDRSHVVAAVSGVGAVSFQWISDSLIRITPAPAAAAQVQISRASNRHARLTNYQDAQVLTEAQMDYDATQLLYIAQEAFDSIGAFASGGSGDMLRANNLSDVFNVAAARQNIGALAKAGDTMTGPLFLTGSPVSPNEAATKAYVDSRVAGIGATGVTSFNARTGAVTLTGADVLAGLGYTPVNKAGDSMTGFLTLAGNPTNPLHAATKQYVDALPGLNTYDWVFMPPAGNTAAVRVNKTQSNPTSRYSGVADLFFRRTGGVPSSAMSVVYWADPATPLTANADLGLDVIARHSNLNGGGIAGARILTAGPRTNTGPRAIIGLTLNATERAADQGRKINWTGGWGSTALLIHPDNEQNLGDGTAQAFNSSFGIVFTASNGPTSVRTHVPINIDESSIAKDGYGMLIQGGGATDGSLDPEAMIRFTARWKNGLDLRDAVLQGDKPAMWLAQGQAIKFSDNSRIYTDPAGNLTFYDAVVGAPKTLASLGGGGGASILPTDNIFTGKNTFAKQVGNMPNYAARFISGTLTGTAPSILLDSGYSTVVDVRRQTNAATEAATGNVAALYLQHAITGQTPVNTAFNGIRCQVQGDMTSAGGVTINDVVSGYFGLMNKGAGTGGWGVHTDAYHAGTAGTTYGMSAEMYRRSATGTTVAFHARSVDEGVGSFSNDYAFLASVSPGGTKGFVALFKGGAFGTPTPCAYGIDLVDSNPTAAALTLPANAKVTFAANREAGPFMRYTGGFLQFGDQGNPAQPVVMQVQMSGDARGKLYANDWWNNSPTGCYLNLGAYDPTAPAVMKLRLTPGASRGVCAGNSDGSLLVIVDGQRYRIPIYAD
jgi:hypothetical protein